MKFINFMFEDLGKIQTIGTVVVIIIGILSSILQFSKIKVNPYSALSRIVRKIVGTSYLSSEIEKIREHYEQQISEVKTTLAEFAFNACRHQIIVYAREVREKKPHTEAERRIVFKYITDYCQLCEEYNFRNGYIDDEIELIKSDKTV